MEPLRRRFYRLEVEQKQEIVKFIGKGENPTSCQICKEALFADDCEKCLAKNRKIKDLLIEGHISLVMKAANILSGPEMRMESCCVGLLALVRAVEGMPSDVRNVSAWIKAWVTNEIKHNLLTDTIIKVPVYADPKYWHMRHMKRWALMENVGIPGEQTKVDIQEILNLIPKNKNERVVLKCMVSGGYSLAEMAEMCSVSLPRVSQIKHGLMDRLYGQLVGK